MIETIDILRTDQVLIFVFGAVVTYSAFKGYRKKDSSSMLFLSIGFGFVTIGAVIAAVLFEWMNLGFLVVDTVQATVRAVGFFFIVYALTATKS